MARVRYGGLPTSRNGRGSPALSDPRLRGLGSSSIRSGSATPGSMTPAGGYDLAAEAYAVTHTDPYEDQARREREIGRRLPAPYQSASALAGTMPMDESRLTSQYQDLHSTAAPYPAASAAGRRMTMSGTVGSGDFQPDMWDARSRFGYGRTGTRGAGFDEEWDTRSGMERRSGRLSAANQKMAQQVNPRWPYLYLTAKGAATSGTNSYVGNAEIRIIAGLSETGGAAASRLFWLGGGMIAQFDMHGWDQVTVGVVRMLAGTYVEFAWVTNGMRSEPNLYFPQRFVPGAGGVAVPEGAYAIIIEDPAPAAPGTVTNLTWITQGAGVGGADLTFVVEVSDGGVTNNVNQYGQPLSVLGTSVQLGTTVDIVWLLRSI